MPIDLMRERIHHYIIVNPKKIGFNRTVSPPLAASVIHPPLSATFFSLSPSPCHPSIFFQLPALSIHKSIIIISMVTNCILHQLWPIVQYNCAPKSRLNDGAGDAPRETELDFVSRLRSWSLSSGSAQFRKGTFNGYFLQILHL